MSFFDSLVQGAADVGTLGLSKYLRDQKENERGIAEQERQKNISDSGRFFKEGLRLGEKTTGATLDELGQGRKEQRSMLQGMLKDDSLAANRFRQSAEQDLRERVSSGRQRGQMFDANVEQAQRKTNIDEATIRRQDQMSLLGQLDQGFGRDVKTLTSLAGSEAARRELAASRVAEDPSNLFTLLGLA